MRLRLYLLNTTSNLHSLPNNATDKQNKAPDSQTNSYVNVGTIATLFSSGDKLTFIALPTFSLFITVTIIDCSGKIFTMTHFSQIRAYVIQYELSTRIFASKYIF